MAQVHLACDGRVQACFVFDEPLRGDALAAARALQADGVRVDMLSGDHTGRAQRLAGILGITSAAGALQSADKLAAVRAVQQGCITCLRVGVGAACSPSASGVLPPTGPL